MISLADAYHVVAATVPLYFAMILAYISVKWCKLFSPDHCSGINKFVAKFSIPLLSFQVISTNNPYKMNLKLILSDLVQKLLALLVLVIVSKIMRSNNGKLNWVITGFSLSTLPNTLILGIPLLKAMYGVNAEALLSQIVVLQSIVWYNLLLFLYELNATTNAVAATTAASSLSSTPSSESIAAREMRNLRFCEGDQEPQEEAESKEGEEEEQEITRPTANNRVKATKMLWTVGRKLINNPNFHATLVGFIWASIHFRWGVKLPEIVDKSIMILSTGGLGMAMFSLGLFMASRRSIIACGIRMATVAMGMKFIAGPALMAVSSLALGLRGTVFKVAIVQAALPQGIVPFVFATEYNVHPDILSTGVIFGMLIAMPIALAYYSLLAL